MEVKKLILAQHRNTKEVTTEYLKIEKYLKVLQPQEPTDGGKGTLL